MRVTAAHRRTTWRHRRPGRPVAGFVTLTAVLLGSGAVATQHIQPTPVARIAEATGPAIPLPLTPLRNGPIEPYPGYDPQTICSPTVKPGVAAFRGMLLKTYPNTRSLGVVRACNIGGTSEHKEGRAFDWGVRAANTLEHAQADRVIAWLLANDGNGNPAARVRRLGIQYIIWNRRIWSASRADEGWRPYSGESGHTDHVHFSFTWAGANRKTSWATNTVQPVTLSAALTSRTPAPGTVPAGTTLTVKGRVGRSDGGPATVVLRLHTDTGATQTLATTHALNDFTAIGTITQSGDLSAVVSSYYGGPTRTFELGHYTVPAEVVSWVTAGTSRPRQMVVLTVHAAPGAGRAVRLDRIVYPRWTPVTVGYTNAAGVATLPIRFYSPSRYRLRAVIVGNRTRPTAMSAVRTQVVR